MNKKSNNVLIGIVVAVVVLIAAVAIYNFTNKKEENKYEKEMVVHTELYLGYYVGKFPKGNEEVIISLEDLRNNGFEPNLDKECDAYVVVKAKQVGFDYKAYVSCPNYETQDYNKYRN